MGERRRATEIPTAEMNPADHASWKCMRRDAAKGGRDRDVRWSSIRNGGYMRKHGSDVRIIGLSSNGAKTRVYEFIDENSTGGVRIRLTLLPIGDTGSAKPIFSAANARLGTG